MALHLTPEQMVRIAFHEDITDDITEDIAEGIPPPARSATARRHGLHGLVRASSPLDYGSPRRPRWLRGLEEPWVRIDAGFRAPANIANELTHDFDLAIETGLPLPPGREEQILAFYLIDAYRSLVELFRPRAAWRPMIEEDW